MRYEGPIVDAHQHFWEPAVNRHPWLEPDVLIPFRYGDYTAIKRPYLPPDYRHDAAGHDVVQTVYVETEWDPADPVGETRYATSLADRYGVPNAIVAQAWLNRPDAVEVLKAQAAHPLVRSVRHKPGRDGAGPTLMSDPAWRRGYAMLGPLGLHFDLQVAWCHLHEAAELARDFPDTTLILNHAGLPAQRDREGLAGWHAAMTDLSACPNVVVKVSGLGVRGQRWTADANGWIVRSVIDLFGAQRCMFGSNFPVDSLCATLDEIIRGFKEILKPLPEAEQAAFFGETAQHIYKIGSFVRRSAPARDPHQS